MLTAGSLLITGLLVFAQLIVRGDVKNIEEGKVPMEELILLGQTLNLFTHPGREVESITLDIAENLFSDGIGKLAGLFPDNVTTPGVSPEQTVFVALRFFYPRIIRVF